MSTGGLISLRSISEEITCNELPSFKEVYGLAIGLIKLNDAQKKVAMYSVPRRSGKTQMHENIAVEATMDGINTVMVFGTQDLLEASLNRISKRLAQLPEQPERPGVVRYGKIIYCVNAVYSMHQQPADAEHILLLDEYPYLSEEALCYFVEAATGRWPLDIYKGLCKLRGTAIALGTPIKS